MSQLYKFSQSLYSLKHAYGQSVDLYQKTESTNVQTGKRTTLKSKIRIKHAIILPSTQYVKGEQIGRIPDKSAGYLDITDSICIIDEKDIPNNYLSQEGDYLITTDNTRYEIDKVVQYSAGGGLILYLKAARGAQLSRIIDKNINEMIRLGQLLTVSHTIQENIIDNIELMDLTEDNISN